MPTRRLAEGDPTTLLFIDTAGNRSWERDASETNKPYLIRLAACLWRMSDRVDQHRWFTTMVSLPPGQEVHPSGTEVNGIQQADLRRFPDFTVSARAAINRIHEMCEQADMMVGHSIEFHAAMLRVTARRTDQTLRMPTEFCTMRRSTSIVRAPQPFGRSGFKWPKLSEAYEFFSKALLRTEPENALKQGRSNVAAVIEVYFGIEDVRRGRL